MLNTLRDWLGFGEFGHSQTNHDHSDHGHTHGVIDATITTTERGIWAIKWSFVILAITAALQIGVVIISSSVALLADTIHNVSDATTAIPLWIAFVLVRRKPTATFTYGLGRVEDLAGIAIVLIILFSAVFAGYEAIDRLLRPQMVTNIGWLTGAGIVGFLGNEIVAVLRIRVGRQINSAALIADGFHARTDGLTSLAVVVGAVGVWLGYPLADPIVGLLITIAIFGIVWQSARSVLTRMLDGVDPGLVDEIHRAAKHVKGIDRITDTKARWLGHKLHVDITIQLDDGLLLAEANAISTDLKHELIAHVPVVSVVSVQYSTAQAEGSHHHAPEPFRVQSSIATGLLEIVDTPEGERMQLRVSKHLENIQASVSINRDGGQTEILSLYATDGDHHCLRSQVSPEEPHEFRAELILDATNQRIVLPFEMKEPEGHLH